MTAVPFMGASGKPEQFIAIRTDITKRKLAEEQMATSLEQLAELNEFKVNLTHSADVAIISTMVDGTITSFNPSAERMFGWSASEVIGKQNASLLTDTQEVIEFARLLSAESGRTIEPGFGVLAEYAQISGYESKDKEWTAVRKDGQKLPVWLAVTGLHNASGDITGYLGVANDLTKVKKAEHQLVQAKELAEASNREHKLRFEQTPLPVWIYDLETLAFLEVNEAALKHYGYSRDEVSQMTVLDLRPAADRAEVLTRVKTTGVRGLNVSAQTHSRHKKRDGTIIEVDLFCRTTRWNDRLAEIVYVSDVTEAEQAKKLLEAAKTKADAANAAKSEFLANMSHEIRTPLNGLMGMIDLTMDMELGPEQREYLGIAKSSSESLLFVINDILDFSKIEAGHLEFDEDTFSLTSFMDELVGAYGIQFARKGIELVCDVDANVPTNLFGDSMRLRQIISNLLSNALKFTEKGEVVLRCTLLSASEGSAMLQFSVNDTGIGIPKDRQSAVFEPFRQVDGSTTRKYGGTGLGLSIATALAKRMNGEIWLDPDYEKGCSFNFTARLKISAEAHAVVPRYDFAGKRALVVDDNATNRMLVAKQLKIAGASSVMCENAAQAMETLGQNELGHFDFAVIDVAMPDTGGFALATHIRAITGSAPLPIVMMSSNDVSGDLKSCALLGHAVYMRKPVCQLQFFEAVEKVMHGAVLLVPARSGATKAPSVPDLRSYNLLVAEDSKVNQLVARRLLEKAGHKVTMVEDGEAAVAAYRAGAFDAILMDVQMPKMDGFEATAKIRAQEATSDKHIPIIALTAHAMTGDEDRCIEAGMDGYVAKPVSTEALREELRRVVGWPLPQTESDANASLLVFGWRD